MVVSLAMPPEAAPYEMPVWPLTGKTWPPGSSEPVSNLRRLLRAGHDYAATAMSHQVGGHGVEEGAHGV